jgi:hypothetical protein
VTYFLTAATQPATTAAPLLPPEVWGVEGFVKEHFTRPQPTLAHYDALLQQHPDAAAAGQEVTR